MPRRAILRLGRHFLGACGLGLLLNGSAWAQFQKTPWPATQATPALDFQDLQGQRWTAERLKGRSVVLNFWATWCPPCKEELPSLQTLHEIGGGDPVVIGINVRETASHGQIRWRVVGEVDWAGPEAGRWVASLSGPRR
jgi:thiol-disulfide isomerase/thioredoxin